MKWKVGKQPRMGPVAMDMHKGLVFVWRRKREAVYATHHALSHEDDVLFDDEDADEGWNSRRGYRVRGLPNLGNTCFFNSVMQSLLAMDCLRTHFMDLEEDGSLGPLTMALKQLFAETNVRTCPRISGPTNLDSLFLAICSKAPQFSEYGQQDSHEFLRCLIDELQAEELSSKLSPNCPDKDHHSFFDVIFGGQLSSVVCCVECGHSSSAHEPFLDLSLPIPTKKSPPVSSKLCLENNETEKDEEQASVELRQEKIQLSIKSCLDYFTKLERLSDEQGWKCDKCSKHNGTKRYLIGQSPSILTIHLKRFQEDGHGGFSKLEKHVSFSETIDVGAYKDPKACRETKKCEYRLLGVVEHSGTLEHGHYSAFVRGEEVRREMMERDEENRKWFYANDSNVCEVSLMEVLESQAYILFYEKT